MINKIKDNAINMIEKRENKVSLSIDKIEQMLLLSSQLNDTLKTLKERKEDVNRINSEVWYKILRPKIQDIKELSEELLNINDIDTIRTVQDLQDQLKKKQ